MKKKRQFHAKARGVNKSKVSKFCLLFCVSVEHIERDIDGKLFNIIKRATVYIWFFSNNSAWINQRWQLIKGAKIAFF